MRARNRQTLARIILAMLFLSIPVWRAAADWSGFGVYMALAELGIEDGSIAVVLRLRESGLARLRSVLGQGADTAADELAGLLFAVSADGERLSKPSWVLTRDPPPADSAKTGEEPYVEARAVYHLTRRPTNLELRPAAGIGKNLGLVVLHRGVPVTDLAPLAEQPARLRLNWTDPWLSRFDGDALARRHTEPHSFLYVEPYEVRHELVLRLGELLPLLDLTVRDPHRIEGADREALQRSIGAFLLGRNPLRVDGELVTPRLDRVEFLRFRRDGMAAIGETEIVDAATAVVGAILVHLTEAPATTVDLEWKLFDARGTPRTVSLEWGRESFDADVTPRDPVFHWSAAEALEPAGDETQVLSAGTVQLALLPEVIMLRAAGAALALVAIGWYGHRRRALPPGAGAELGLILALAGCIAFYPEIARLPIYGKVAGTPREERVKQELPALLHNVYRAFQLPGEEAAYDRLAMSLTGDMLDEVYLRQRHALRQRDGGVGGEGRVERVELLESTVEAVDPATGNCTVSAAWIARGTVSHWGHAHPRSTSYAARLTLRPAEDGRLRIAHLEFTDTRRAGLPSS